MRPESTSTVILALLGALYAAPACAQRRPLTSSAAVPPPSDHLMVDGADVVLLDEIMNESLTPTTLTSQAPAATQPVATATATANLTQEPVIPINALIYNSSPGPKGCRGSVVMNMNFPKPPPTTPKCYNITTGKNAAAQCGKFVANKVDGCQARLFAEPNCQMFVNLAVFQPEEKPVGGMFKSVEYTCGIISVEPAPLNMAALQNNIQQPV